MVEGGGGGCGIEELDEYDEGRSRCVESRSYIIS